MTMLSSWGQALSFTFLIFNVTRILAWNLSSTFSDIDNYFENDFDKMKTWFEEKVGEEASKELQSIDGVIYKFTMGHNAVPPISTSLKTSQLQSDVTVGLYCNTCNYTQPEAFDFAKDLYPNWSDSWFGVALDSFDAVFEIDVDLSASANGDLTLSLLTLDAAVDGVAVEVDFQLYLTADASASMSFTTGLNLSLAKPAAIMMPALDPIVNLTQSKRIGFNPDDFSLKPIFNASMPKLDFNMNFALRTVFSVTVEDINVGALYLDLPAFDLTVNTLQHKTSNCQTPSAGTPPDQIYDELIHMGATLNAILSYEILGGELAGQIESWQMWDGLDECYAFLPGLGSLGPVPASSKSSVLTAPPIMKCTTDGKVSVGAALKSLSPGAKAGAAIGALAGVSLIAALAWYAGRASQRQGIKSRITDSAWASPRSRFGRFFDRGNGSGSKDLLTFTPSIQAGTYAGGSVSSPNAEMQQQLAHQSWQTAKKGPFVTTDEAVSPDPAYTPLGDDHGPSTAGLEETTQPSSGRYDVPKAGPAEGLGLLQGEARPAVQWKKISRKMVPGHRNARESS